MKSVRINGVSRLSYFKMIGLLFVCVVLSGCGWKEKFEKSQKELAAAQEQISALKRTRSEIEGELRLKVDEIGALSSKLDQADVQFAKYQEIFGLIKKGLYEDADRQIRLIDKEVFSEIELLISRYYILTKQEHEIASVLHQARQRYGVSVLDRGHSIELIIAYTFICILTTAALIWPIVNIISRFSHPVQKNLLIATAIAFSIGPILISYSSGSSMSVFLVRSFFGSNSGVNMVYNLFDIEEFLLSYFGVIYIAAGALTGYLIFIVSRWSAGGPFAWLLIVFLALEISVIGDVFIYSTLNHSAVFIQENIVLIISGLSVYGLNIMRTRPEDIV